MSRLIVSLLLLVMVGACQSGHGGSLPPTIHRPESHRRVEAWREDLAHLASELSARHVAPFRKVSEAEFLKSVDQLDERLASLDDAAVLVELARISASIGDGHTGILLHDSRLGFQPGPLWLVAFEDGVFLKGVIGDLGVDVLNRKLIRVGGVEIDDALARLAPLIARDNEGGLLVTGPAYLNLPGVLHAIGLSDEPQAAVYTFAGERGDEIEIRCTAVGDSPKVFAVRYSPGVSGAPLAERLRASSYAYERIDDAVLLQYNACTNDPRESFQHFCQRVFADMDASPPRQLIVDLRWNSGGDSAVTHSLLHALRRRQDLTKQGRLTVLIGPRTLSSGMWAAVDLAREFDAVLIGEPSGGAPNAPGEVGRIVLPSSKLVCTVARRMWNKGGDRYSGSALLPDVEVSESSRQHFSGRDPVLETALAWGRDPSRFDE